MPGQRALEYIKERAPESVIAKPAKRANEKRERIWTADEAVDCLPERLCKSLARVHEAPADIAALILVTLPYEGSLRTLEKLGAVEITRKETGEQGSDIVEVELTDLGNAVVALCAAQMPDDPPARRQRYEHLVDPANSTVTIKAS